MSVNISNTEYNFLIKSETAIWSCSQNTPVFLNSLSFITLRSFIALYQSDGGKVNKIFVFVKHRTFNHPLDRAFNLPAQVYY